MEGQTQSQTKPLYIGTLLELRSACIGPNPYTNIMKVSESKELAALACIDQYSAQFIRAGVDELGTYIEEIVEDGFGMLKGIPVWLYRVDSTGFQPASANPNEHLWVRTTPAQIVLEEFIPDLHEFLVKKYVRVMAHGGCDMDVAPASSELIMEEIWDASYIE